ncbi:YeiH family protein [Streptomyces sp. NPDC015661]|uniref:YeiH family protein n=1 Tax=Streptomyces sp. NPDC015661 TaxID=3364961 RepID=UPI0036FF500A
MTNLPVPPGDHDASRPAATPGPRVSAADVPRRRTGRARTLVSGLAVTALATAVAAAAHRALPSISPTVAAVVLGVLAANLGLLPAACGPGLQFAAKRLMRLGVALLGLNLALGDVLGLGWEVLAMVTAVVAVTFLGTRWLGRRLGLPGDQPLLIATGFSICGASAIAAVNAETDSEEEDVVTAVALVTLCGTLAIVLLPILHRPLGLDAAQFGLWTGASVHDVGQVVAAAQTAGPTALNQAVVVKLMRVALLAPLLVLVRRHLTIRRSPEGRTGGSRPPLVPLFVACFLGLAALRSTECLPSQVISRVQRVDELLLAAGLFGLGTAVDIRRLLRTGGRALTVGLASWLLIAGVSYAGVLLIA